MDCNSACAGLCGSRPLRRTGRRIRIGLIFRLTSAYLRLRLISHLWQRWRVQPVAVERRGYFPLLVVNRRFLSDRTTDSNCYASILLDGL